MKKHNKFNIDIALAIAIGVFVAFACAADSSGVVGDFVIAGMAISLVAMAVIGAIKKKNNK